MKYDLKAQLKILQPLQLFLQLSALNVLVSSYHDKCGVRKITVRIRHL